MSGAAHKACEDVLIAVVVADGGKVGTVAMQCLGVEGRTIIVEAAAELGSQMLGVGGAAAVAAEVYLATAFKRGGYHIGSLFDTGKEVAVSQNILFCSDTLCYGF